MLIKCPECDHDVSDKAVFCPSCGYGISDKQSKKLCKPKKMRLPNGFGRITKIGGKNLRKPYRAMVTVGTDLNGNPVGKILRPEGYFKTYNEAYQALMEYHKSPFDLDKCLTVKEVYEKWLSEYETIFSKSYITQIKCAWKYCDSIKEMPIRVLKPSQLKFVIEHGTKIERNGTVKDIPINTKGDVKTIFDLMFKYAIERDLVDRNIAKDVSVGKALEQKVKDACKPHVNFTDDELNWFWENADDLFVRMILIQCYSGWRPGELMSIELDAVDLNEWTFTGGNKTDNGKNRVVPIHSKIRHLVKANYDLAKEHGLTKLIVLNSGKRFVNPNSSNVSNGVSLGRYKDILKNGHRLHDGRVTFVTLAKKYNVDEYAIKRLIGHSISDLTERVYTIRNIDWLRDEIEKIK